MNLQPAILDDYLVRIVPLKETDFEKLFQVAADPMIWEQHPTNDRYKREVFQVYFDSAVKSESAFLFYDKATGELMGSSRYYDYNPEESKVAIGYTFLARKYWGGEFNRSIKKLMLDYAFQHVNTVIFHIGPNNIRSQKAILKLGANKIGEEVYNGILQYVYEICKENWEVFGR
jgi:RimJ/RimL family protein N-acetyltransferase